MLSVGSREDGRKGLGLGFGGMEENEVEEGEACSGQEDDTFIDPDALSYIDEKIQDVLGHFQKDFEGGVSAENLGAKFGGYGSFLPTYQRSPSIWSQPRSPPRQPNQIGTRSPPNLSLEGARLNPSVPTAASVTKNNTASAAPLLESTCKKNTLGVGESLCQHDSFNKPLNASDQKSLKVRIKVGPESAPARDISAIYSGLGLDISPSSTPEDSPYGSEGLSPEPRYAPDESPMTIIQIMTCFEVPGGYLLSPLADSLLHLTKKESPMLKHCKTGTVNTGAHDFFAAQADVNSPMRDAKGLAEKKRKSFEKNGKFMEVRNMSCKDDITTILKREIDIETPAGQEIVSSALNISLLCSAKDVDEKEESQISGKSVKSTRKTSGLSKEAKKILMKERISSSDLSKGNDLELRGSIENSRGVNSVNEPTCSKGKPNSKTSLVEKSIEESKTTNYKDDSYNMARDIKVEKNYDTVKCDSDEFKRKKDRQKDSLKLKSAQKVASRKQDGENMAQGKDQVYEGKRKSKGSQTNVKQSLELMKENESGLAAVVSKEKKKSSHARGDHPENKPKVWKSHKGTHRGSSKETFRDGLGDVKSEEVDNRTDSVVNHSKDKVKEIKIEESLFTEKSKERLNSMKLDNSMNPESFVNLPLVAPVTSNALTTDMVAAPNAPVVIKENWVCCDECQIWRLLPYEMNADNLPKKWLCSMQLWLPPGMNRCFISEEETTKALNALYHLPAPETNAHVNGVHDVTALSITSADGQCHDQNLERNMLNMPAIGKKKNGLKDASLIHTNSSLAQIPNSVKKNQQASIRSRSLSDVNQCPPESNSLSDIGLVDAGKALDFTSDKCKHKQKEKPKIRARHSDGGGSIEKGGKHYKLKGKRDVDQDGSRASKKIKTEGLPHSHDDWNSDHDTVGKAVVNEDSGLSTKLTGKNLRKYTSSSSKDLKCETSGNLPASGKKKGQVKVLSNGKTKEVLNSSDVDNPDNYEFATKKRKLKEWKESQGEETLMSIQHLVDNSVDVKEALSESEPRKEKKGKVSKSEGKEPTTSKADGRVEKKGRLTKIVFSGNRERLSDGIQKENGDFAEKEHQVGQYQGNAASRCALDGIDSLKKDIGYGQPSTAATSSSSKVSCSRKSRANFQEARGSPVESVSSSPLRIPNMEKFSSRRDLVGKDDANGSFSVIESPKRYSGEVDGRHDGSGARRKEKASSVQQRSIESHTAIDPGVPDSCRVMCDYQDTEANRVSGGKTNDEMHLKTFGVVHDDLLHMEFEERNLRNGVVKSSSQQNNYCELPEKDHVQGHNKPNNYHLANGSSQRKSGKSSSSRSKERHRNSKFDADKGKVKVSESFIEQQLYCTKNASSNQYEVDTNSFEHSNYDRDLKNENNNYQEKDEKDSLRKKDVMAKGPGEGRRNSHSIHGGQKTVNANDPDMLPKQHDNLNLKGVAAGASSGKFDVQENLLELSLHEDKRLSQHLPDRIDRLETASGRGKLPPALPSTDKHQTQSQGPHGMLTSVRGCKSVADPIEATYNDASKADTQSRKLDNQDGAHRNSVRQATPTGPDASSPIRKDGQSAASVALKEARDLKHTANHLKNEGLEAESTSLYFQAALKFLQYASLLEPPNVESARHVEANQSIQMYSETAKLCEFVAHEYEKCKDMAAAALAYKCTEVAYMKVAYFKHSSASRDQYELQKVLQMVLPGESPSSSASDIDNLNNQGMVDKSASAKGVNSPQIAGNHVIAARNRPNFMRLLNFTNETVCAFEASRKSQNAIALASASLEKDGVDGISSVKKVLDFNFHNIERLLPLVRLSMEALSR